MGIPSGQDPFWFCAYHHKIGHETVQLLKEPVYLKQIMGAGVMVNWVKVLAVLCLMS